MSPAPAHPDARRGGLAAAGGFFFWGLVPLYWKQMQGIAPLELMAHRIVWSFLLLAGIMAWQHRLHEIAPLFRDHRLAGRNFLASVLLATNWTIYIWAVNSGHVIESSLGYFLVPLFNVLLGSVILHERLRPLQWAAIGCAAAGVLTLLVRLGHVPWIGFSIAATWSAYSFLKKQSSFGAMAGLLVETLLLFPLAGGALLWWLHTGAGALGRVGAWQQSMVLSAGIVTAVPLLLFSFGAQRIRLTTLGLLQYLTPSVQFLIGLLVYREAFDGRQFQAYALIWLGLLLYTADNFRTLRFGVART